MARPSAPKPPSPKRREELRSRFRFYYNGWETRTDGGRRRPPVTWNSEDAREFCRGWDAADARERLVGALVDALERPA